MSDKENESVVSSNEDTSSPGSGPIKAKKKYTKKKTTKNIASKSHSPSASLDATFVKSPKDSTKKRNETEQSTDAEQGPSVPKKGKKRILSENQAKATNVTTDKKPPLSFMVDNAIKEQQQKLPGKKIKGTSFISIKSYIMNTFEMDNNKQLASRIKKYMTTSIQSGHITQISGKGFTGSFKMNANTGKSTKKALNSRESGKITKPKNTIMKKTSHKTVTAEKNKKKNEMSAKNENKAGKSATVPKKSAKRKSATSTNVSQNSEKVTTISAKKLKESKEMEKSGKEKSVKSKEKANTTADDPKKSARRKSIISTKVPRHSIKRASVSVKKAATSKKGLASKKAISQKRK